MSRIQTIVVGVLFSAIILGASTLTVILQDRLEDKDNALIAAEVMAETLYEENDRLKNRLHDLEFGKGKSKKDISNYIQTHYKTVGPVIANAIADEIIIASDKYDVPLVAIVATMERESAFNPAAKGKDGERGLMQVMAFWKKTLEIKSSYEFHKIKVGIDSGVFVMRHYLDKTNNNMKRALLKYQGGDPSYVKIVYANMGKFVMYRSFANITVQEQTIETGASQSRNITTGEITNNDPSPSSGKGLYGLDIASSGVFMHTVKKGDMLGEIAKWYTGSMSNWKKILEVNPHIIPNRMQIGSQITIPKGLLITTKEFKKENE